MTNVDEYTYEVINNENDAQVCARLIAEEFTSRNLLTIFDKISLGRFFELVSWPWMAEALDQRLSLLTRHRSSGEIIAAIITMDLFVIRKKYPYDASSSPAVMPIEDLSDEMDEIFIRQDFGKELISNMVLYILMGATRVQHSSKGVASRLRVVMCDHARNTQGFQYAIIQSTNQLTRHIYVDKMGGKELRIVDPRTWIWKKNDDGLSCPYKDYKGESISIILIKLTPDRDQ
ncbi:unnamed protein product [Rotaria sp. Silwood2]|nr:unnamed protein product [Rotaria sp. Silwood2]CAF2929221.1 unnamed protein product [Rotaria sp. Silwood2]CAF3274690.1 unnamed protein product [Rotaria sp. Silwood2]CAF4304782.1 unnamed protein product [Rotaria sp. Silwood2]CAF4307030.1 unnamed protein product [Rotaria sp. Silwood2]